MPSRKPVPSEHAEQVLVVDYVRVKYPSAFPFLFAVPNGAYKSHVSARRFKAEGLSPGYPDLAIDLPVGDFHGLRIEMKRSRGAATSPEQLAWIARLRSVGYAAHICRGATEAINVIDAYLAGRILAP